MKQNVIKLAFLFLGLTFGTVSCSKSDDPAPTPAPVVYGEENPLAGYLATGGFTNITNVVNSSSYEFGLKFKPKVNGNINKFVVKLPDAQTNLRITLWDASVTPKVVLSTEIIASVASGTETTKSISPIALTSGKEYMVTMNANDWYTKARPTGSATYPIDAGNISVTGYAWGSGTAQTYPTNVDNTYYAGDISFVFQRTN